MDYIICFAMLVVISIEVWFILVRNKRLLVKGQDDFFLFTLSVLFIILTFPLLEGTTSLKALRNILVLVTVLATTAVRRGFSEQGLEKLFFTIPWNKIQQIYITNHQINKICVRCKTDFYTWKLFFPKHKLKQLLYVLQHHANTIHLEDCLHANVESC